MEKIADFKGIHKGKRLFILASGPSLEGYDLSKLERRLVMGLNRSFLLYPQTHYHCCMDQRLFELYSERMKETRYLFTLEGRPMGIPIKLLGSEGFSWDLEQGIYSGYTISYLAIQIAVYMGFTQIFFLGLDLKHQGGNTHFFGKDFHSRAHETTEFPKMIRMLSRVPEVLENGPENSMQASCPKVEIFNCSPITEFTSFPFMDFEEAVCL